MVSESTCIRGRCLFAEGGLRELVKLVIRGECLTRGDSIVVDRSFALVPYKSELNCCTAVII